jgi:hypothetical protein
MLPSYPGKWATSPARTCLDSSPSFILTRRLLNLLFATLLREFEQW